MLALNIVDFFNNQFFTPLTQFFESLVGWMPPAVSWLCLAILAAFVVLAIIGIWT